MRPEPTTPIVRRGEDAWGRAAAGPAKLDHHRAIVHVSQRVMSSGIGAETVSGRELTGC